jgi:hypothetical protein
LEEINVVIYLKAGGVLRDMLKPDVDMYTRKVEVETGKNIREILTGINVSPANVAFVYTEGQMQRLDYVPLEGQHITLQPPVSGG